MQQCEDVRMQNVCKNYLQNGNFNHEERYLAIHGSGQCHDVTVNYD